MLSVSGRMSTKTGTRAAQHERVGGRDEGEGRHDRPRRPGRCRASSAAISSAAVQEWVSSTAPTPIRSSSQAWQRSRERAVAGKLAARDRVADVVELPAGKRRPVEGDGHAGAPPRTQQLIGRASPACHTRPAGAAGNTQSRCSRKKNTVVTPSPNSTTHSWRCPRTSTPRWRIETCSPKLAA